MNIQSTDRLRLLCAMLQLQNAMLVQNVAFGLDLARWRGCGHHRQCWVRIPGSYRGHCLASMKF